MKPDETCTLVAPSEFVFSYLCGPSACYLVVGAPDSYYVSSFIVFETNATSMARMAIAVAHSPQCRCGDACKVADQVLTELFAHAGTKDFAPSAGVREQLRSDLAAWLPELGSLPPDTAKRSRADLSTPR